MAQVVRFPVPDFASKGSDDLAPVTAATLTPRPAKVAVSAQPWTIDELMRSRSKSYPDEPILGYPNERGEYVEYSYLQLDGLAFQAAQKYAKVMSPRKSSKEKEKVVALLGPSNLDYLISILALSKLGFTVLFLSTRISIVAYQSLLESTSTHHLVIHESFQKTARSLQAALPSLMVQTITKSSDLDKVALRGDNSTRLDYGLTHELETEKVCWIIHSSGSTGLPKPIYQTHSAALQNYANNLNMRGFITLPLFHAHGISSVFRAFTSVKKIYMHTASLPLTRNNLLNIMAKHDFEVFYGVPYALKLLAETQEGVEALASLKVVMFGGSACPDALGDRLVDAGVNLISHYGTTETGQLMTSFREQGDKAWNYVRPSAALKPFLKWEPQNGDIFELVVLDGWASKVASNRSDGSYATKDLFVPHPTIPDAWRYFARLDDTIVLLNGEKVVPTETEQAIRENKNVLEAIIVGNGRPQPGMMVIPGEGMTNVPEKEFLQLIWPVIEKANVVAPAYAQLSLEMVRVLPNDIEFPRTDKGTVIRQAFYKKFEKEIEDLYTSAETTTLEISPRSDAEIRATLRATLLEMLGPLTHLEDGTDFFALGLDSLQALRLRTVILKNLPILASSVGMNVVFDFPTIDSLTQTLLHLQGGVAMNMVPVEEEMQALIEKYGSFPAHMPSKNTKEGHYVVVTGATGSLGAHIIAKLATQPNIKRIHCLVRAKSDSEARRRVVTSLRQRCIYHQLSLVDRQKIVALPADFSKIDLGLEADIYETVTEDITDLIHCAWSVNFNLKLSSFEKGCIAGARNLLLLCLAAKRPSPATFNFCSSVSAVAATPGGHIPEAIPESLTHAQNMGYAQSKLVTEHLVQRAADQTGISARTLRVGQIVADTQNGIWNATEAIPLMLQAAITIGAIPALDESLLWLPVDIVAKAIAEISLSNAGAGVTNVVARDSIHWTQDLLPKLHAAGLAFEELEQREWIKRLRDSEADADKNPPIKLLEFFTKKYDNENRARKGLRYDTELARSHSPTLATAHVLNQGLVDKFVAHFLATSWNMPSKDVPMPKHKIIIVAGPCGAGKTTVATAISEKLNCPCIEGDAYHDKAAIAKMASCTGLTDDDRWAWLARLRAVSAISAIHSLEGIVVLTCSALKRSYRDVLRGADDKRVQTWFVLLQVSEKQNLEDRLEKRSGHYMKKSMVNQQLELVEEPAADEVDVLPVDASRVQEDVIEEVFDLLQSELL